VSVYLDSSCLLKLLFPEPESAAVAALVAAEPRVVVSTLARLEARVRIAARVTGGSLKRPLALRLVRQMDATLASAPFEVVSLPAGVAELAEQQVLFARTAVHCRSLDRLHLATMQALALDRILTSDVAQGNAARSLGFIVLHP